MQSEPSALFVPSETAQSKPSTISVSSEPAPTTLQPTKKETIRIGIIDRFSPRAFISTVAGTFAYLERRFEDYELEFIEISKESPEVDIQKFKPDFLIASAWDFSMLQSALGLQQIVTKKLKNAENVLESVGSAVLVRSDKSDITRLSDLKGRSVATDSDDNIENWFGVQGELHALGHDPNRFFSSVRLTRNQVPSALSLVQHGAVDAAILPACEFERLVEEGRIKKEDFRILNLKNDKHCARSTLLYPDAVFSFLPHVPAPLRRDMTVALLTMDPTEHNFEWIFASSFLTIHELMKSLQLGPFAGLKEISLQNLLKEYKDEILGALFLTMLLALHAVHLRYRLARKTEELSREMEKRRQSELEVHRHQQKLLKLERDHSLSQLSAIFAHEVKQPLASVLYYAAVLKRLNPAHENAKQHLDRSIEKIVQNTEKTVKIVDHVRNYVRHSEAKRQPLMLNPVIENLVSQQFDRPLPTFLTVDIEQTRAVRVEGDTLELELVLINLVKNALYEIKKTDSPTLVLSTALHHDKIEITIENSGLPVSPDVFTLLGVKAQTEKTEGLGAGLLICNSILEKYRSALKFRMREPGGLIISFELNVLDILDKKE